MRFVRKVRIQFFAVFSLDKTSLIRFFLYSLLGAIFPLPRILYAMAQDGLLFKVFGKVNDTTQTPIFATIISGLLASNWQKINNRDSTSLHTY